MIYPLVGLLVGLISGTIAAKRQKGTTADIVHWALVLGIVGAVIGLFLLLFIDRSMR